MIKILSRYCTIHTRKPGNRTTTFKLIFFLVIKQKVLPVACKLTFYVKRADVHYVHYVHYVQYYIIYNMYTLYNMYNMYTLYTMYMFAQLLCFMFLGLSNSRLLILQLYGCQAVHIFFKNYINCTLTLFKLCRPNIDQNCITFKKNEFFNLKISDKILKNIKRNSSSRKN